MTPESNLIKLQLQPFFYDLTKRQQALAWEEHRARLPIARLTVYKDLVHTLKMLLYRSMYRGEIKADAGHIRPGRWYLPDVFGPGKGYEICDAMHWEDGTCVRGFEVVYTPELKAFIAATRECGYCGTQVRPGPDEPWYCQACLGSPHLKPADLKLLRLNSLGNSDRKLLTGAEYAEILPKYEAAQAKREWLDAAPRRLTEFRTKLAEDHRATVKVADTEYRGKVWMLDHGFGIDDVDNAIYYAHESKWRLGWWRPLTEEKAAELEKKMSGFPGIYEITKKE